MPLLSWSGKKRTNSNPALYVGGARGGTLYSKRYAGGCGLNSPNLDFLPVQNIEDFDPAVGGVGAVPVGESRC